MSESSRQIDMSVLPLKVQEELIDFYQFLAGKYGKKKESKNKTASSKLPEEFYHPIKVKRYLDTNREEIY